MLSSGTSTFSSSLTLDNASYTSFVKVQSNAAILVDVTLASSEVRLIDCISAGATVDYDGQLWVVRGKERVVHRLHSCAGLPATPRSRAIGRSRC